MSNCSSCGHKRSDSEFKCSECGSFYLKIYELIAEEEVLEERSSFRGQCKGIIRSSNVKHELIAELKRVIAESSNKSIFTLFVIIAFVFALVISVL